MAGAPISDVVRDGFGWREAGSSCGGAPVVLLHGLTGSRLSWEPQLAALGMSRRVVAWDLPGYGDSAPLEGSPSFSSFAAAVVRFIDVIGAERVHLVGLSFGGMITQYVAATHADRLLSLSLMATSPKFGLDGTQPDEWRAARLAALDAGEEPIDFAPGVLRAIAGPGISDDALAGQVAAAARVPSSGLRVSIEVLVTHDSRPLLGSIDTPTMVLVGALDGETPVEYAQALAGPIAGSMLHVVPGAGHLLNVEAPSTVNELLMAHVAVSEAGR